MKKGAVYNQNGPTLGVWARVGRNGESANVEKLVMDYKTSGHLVKKLRLSCCGSPHLIYLFIWITSCFRIKSPTAKCFLLCILSKTVSNLFPKVTFNKKMIYVKLRTFGYLRIENKHK